MGRVGLLVLNKPIKKPIYYGTISRLANKICCLVVSFYCCLPYFSPPRTISEDKTVVSGSWYHIFTRSAFDNFLFASGKGNL